MFNIGLRMFSSILAVTADGTRTVIVERSLKERFLSRPWKPWVTKKTIQVTNYKPAIFRVGDKIVYHPALEAQIKSIISAYNHDVV